MKTIRLIKHYGSCGPGAILSPEMDAVADALVNRGVAVYVEEPVKQKPVVKKQAWVK